MQHEEIQTVRLILNEGQARAKLDGLRAQLEDIRKKRQEALDRGNTSALRLYDQDIKKITRQMERMQSRAENIGQVLTHLDQASPRQLQNTLRRITQELNSGAVQRGSQEWNKLVAALKETRGELQKVQEGLNGTTSTTTDPWVRLNSIVGVLRSGADALGALRSRMGEYTQAFADMGEHVSNVAKYTGLSARDVDELNEVFKQMDTRTPREKLNDLAADAGRLGLQSKEAVRDFVEAADTINIALGEDLGEDAVKNIGKLAQLFGEDDRRGLKQAMLSTASVINELAQSSSAAEGYLLEFTSRLAGVGQQAGLSQSQIMAFGSILDQAGMNVELSATALQNVLMALYRNPAEMARIAGLDVKRFTDQLKTDANGAVLTFLGALQATGGLEKLAPMLEQMKLSGMGVSATLSTLSANLDSLKETQQQAADAFEAGTSATQEAQKANSTAAAQLEKQRKALADVRVEIGRQLLPAYNALTAAQLAGATGMKNLIRFVTEYRAVLVPATVAVVGYDLALRKAAITQALTTAGTKALTVAQRIAAPVINLARIGLYGLKLSYSTLTGATAAATRAQHSLNAALRANPLGMAITLTMTIVGAIWSMTAARNRETDALRRESEVRKRVNGLQEEGLKNADREQAEIIQLNRVLHDASAKLDDRREALRRIKEIVPGYLGQLDREGRLTEDNTRAIDDYIEALKRKAVQQALAAGMQEAVARKVAAARKKDTAEKGVRHSEQELKKEEYAPSYGMFSPVMGAERVDLNAGHRKPLEDALKQHRKNLADAKKELTDAEATITAIEEQSRRLETSLLPTEKSTSGDGTSTRTGTGTASVSTGAAKDEPLKAAAEKIRTEAQQTRNALRLQLDNGLTDHRSYSQAVTETERLMYDRLKQLYHGHDKELADLEKERLDAAERHRKEETAWSLKELEQRKAAEQELIRDNFIHGTLTAEQYRREQERAELDHLRRKAEYLKRYGTPEEAAEAERRYTEQSQQAQLQSRQDFWHKVEQFRRDFLQRSTAEQQQVWTTYAQELHDRGLLSEEEYQKALEAIRKKYSDKEQKQDDDSQPQGDLGGPSDPMASGITTLMTRLADLQEAIKSGQATWNDYAGVAVGALGMVSAMASAASQLVQANQAAEEAKVRRRYAAEIKQAGKNRKKKQQLEEQQQKDLAKIKSKYAKKAMAMQITQAIANTASNAILAFGSVLQHGVPWTYPLAAVAAATAVASGMMQVAAIRKQAAAQSEGYYSGGFTGGRSYRRPAGVVHEGEFVANHYAVENPHLAPVFRLIDEAQQRNMVAGLTAADVSRSLSLPAAVTAVSEGVSPSAHSATGAASVEGTDVLNRLADRLETPLQAVVVLDGPDGLDRQWRKYQRLQRH